MSNYLQWKKSGRSECGRYQASRISGFYLSDTGPIKLADKAESSAENRAICQRHAWKIASHQAINMACNNLISATESGAAVLTHALRLNCAQVSRWRLGRALVPPRHCERIAELFADATGDIYFLDDLRPDLEFYRDRETNSLKWRKRSAIAGGAES